MERRHEEMIEGYLEAVYGQGWTVVPRWKLYNAYNADRLGKAVWRDLLQRWREITKKGMTKHKLVAYMENKEELLLICGDPPKTTHKKLVGVDELADDLERNLGMNE